MTVLRIPWGKNFDWPPFIDKGQSLASRWPKGLGVEVIVTCNHLQDPVGVNLPSGSDAQDTRTKLRSQGPQVGLLETGGQQGELPAPCVPVFGYAEASPFSCFDTGSARPIDRGMMLNPPGGNHEGVVPIS